MTIEAPLPTAAEGSAVAPWETVAPEEQLFVLITGANSGIGLGTGQRLIDDFLATRSLTSHLVIIPTTRSDSKSLVAISALRAHAEYAAKTSTALRARYAGNGDKAEEYNWQDAVRRIHVLSLTLDLCDLRGVYAFAERLCRGRVSNPEGLEGEYLRNVRIPRLDTVIFNAAYGNWSGCNYPKSVWKILSEGLVQAVTYPTFKISLPTSILNERESYGYPEKPLLGEVFAACVFGHYVLAHQLLPLLSRHSANESRGRIVWSSSVEAVEEVYNADDMQCFLKPAAYESAKRLTDIVALSYSLPSVRRFSGPFLTMDEESGGDAAEKPVPPKMYLTHPGVVASTLFPVPWFLFWAYELALVVARWVGSPWHNVDGYKGATSAAWLTLQDQAVLDDMQADRIKWGSSTDRHLVSDVKKTEVDGWGWEGKVETDKTIAADTAAGVLHKSVGRRLGTKNATEESLVEFEEMGARAWEEMERLRHQWAKIIKLDTNE
ncbi:3-keto-steroid reductase [Trichoderma asperellum]|uniref:3-keto-steroid reductase n=1 Tax=Trichoderma asperellum TaxID=101201 RepID=A0A6V8QZ38_TRIAP|nr:3-keto-steroid reductase [Trichoderma asperellum]